MLLFIHENGIQLQGVVFGHCSQKKKKIDVSRVLQFYKFYHHLPKRAIWAAVVKSTTDRLMFSI